MKRYAGALAAAALISLVAASCGSQNTATGASGTSKASAARKVTSFRYWTPKFLPSQIKSIDAAFNSSHPGLRVSGQYIAKSDEYLPKVLAALKTNTQPTVVFDENVADLPLYSQSGKLIPLNGKMTRLTNALYPGVRKSLFYHGKQLGMALAGEGDIVLFYNKKDFAKAGITAPPATLKQLQQDAAKLTVPSKHRYGIYIPLGDAEWISYDFEAWLWANGGHLLNANETKAEFASPAGISTLTSWVDMMRKLHVAPSTSYAQGGNFDGSPAFASNTVAMLIDGQWDLSTFQKSGLDFGVAEFPKGTCCRATNIGEGVEALFKTSAAKDRAGTTFIKWIASPAEAAKLAAQSDSLPSSPVQLQQPVLKNFIASNPNYKVFQATEKYGHVRPITPAYNSVSQDLWTEINAALAGSVSPSRALAIASKKADATLSSQTG